MSTFTDRTLKKANYMMNKFGNYPKKYPKWALYKRWVRERQPPPYPFNIHEQDRPNASKLSPGSTIIQLRMSKRLKTTNQIGVIKIKEFMKKILGTQDVTIDDLANFIVVYTYNRPPTPEPEPKPVNRVSIKPKLLSPPSSPKKKTVEQNNTQDIQLNITEVEDWEDIVI